MTAVDAMTIASTDILMMSSAQSIVWWIGATRILPAWPFVSEEFSVIRLVCARNDFVRGVSCANAQTIRALLR